MAEILIVDDTPEVLCALAEMLRRDGYAVRTAQNGKEAVECYRRQPADLVITDIIMPEADGLETILCLRKNGHPVKILAMSGANNATYPLDYLNIARKFGAMDTLSKPFTREMLQQKIGALLSDGEASSDSRETLP